MKHHEVSYVVTDTDGNRHCSARTFHGLNSEEEVRVEFWRNQNFKFMEFLAPNAKMAGVEITDISER